jgi:hypothetical protein
MHPGVADVVLPTRIVGSVDHELLGLRVVGRGGPDGLDVGAVAGLGHREGTHELTADRALEELVVVPLGPELEDRAPEQAELDAELDDDRQIAEGRGLERRHRGADVTAPAVLLGEAVAGLAGRGEPDDLLLDEVSVLSVLSVSASSRTWLRCTRFLRTASRTTR